MKICVFLLTLTLVKIDGHVLYDDFTTTTPRPPRSSPDSGTRIEPMSIPGFIDAHESRYIPFLDMNYRRKTIARIQYTPPLTRETFLNIFNMLKDFKPRVDVVTFEEYESAPEMTYRMILVRNPPFYVPVGKR